MKRNTKIALTYIVGISIIGAAVQAIVNPSDNDFINNDLPVVAENNYLYNYDSSNTDITSPTSEPANQNTVRPESMPSTPDPQTMNGRGISDGARSEPQYVGVTGYVVIGYEQEHALEKTDSFTETPWTVPIANNETIEHKTEVTVKYQDLEHTGWGFYSGFLTVERTDTKEELIIDVKNFITKPYWTYDDLNEAALVGYYIAEYQQVSSYSPVSRDNEEINLKDGIKVLVVGPTGLFGGNSPDSELNSIEAIVFKEWTKGYGGVSVFFNPADLTIIY